MLQQLIISDRQKGARTPCFRSSTYLVLFQTEMEVNPRKTVAAVKRKTN